jgi:predicted N-acetyltransferase YhbS
MPGKDWQMPIYVTCVLEKDMTPALARGIQELQHAAFPHTSEFAHQRWWHTPLSPEELWFVARRDGRLVGSVRLVLRRITTVAGDYVVGGLANVCSHPDARGCGAAKACALAAQEKIAHGGTMDFGLLFCAVRVRDFYAKLGWTVVTNDVIFGAPPSRHGYGVPALSGYAMIFPGRLATADWPTGGIDLNGQNW